jgi:oxygen-dependent protoporphyrinogen oxidase
VRVRRWIKSNPQYNVGHELKLKEIESCLGARPGLLLAGCSYKGVGLPDCIASGRRAGRDALAAI